MYFNLKLFLKTTFGGVGGGGRMSETDVLGEHRCMHMQA